MCFFWTVAACIEETAAHADFTPTSPDTLHNFNVIVTYVCDTGYNHSTGDLVRTCQNDGTWSGALPACPSKFRTLNGEVRLHWYFGKSFFGTLENKVFI